MSSKTCPTCGTGNRPVARFCKKCATPLGLAAAAAGASAPAPAAQPAAPLRAACGACGKSNRAEARFCRGCGRPMAGKGTPVLPTPPAAEAPARPARGPGPTAAPARRPSWLVLFVAIVLGAAALWWLRGSEPPPAEPVEEFLTDPAPAASAPGADPAADARPPAPEAPHPAPAPGPGPALAGPGPLPPAAAASAPAPASPEPAMAPLPAAEPAPAPPRAQPQAAAPRQAPAQRSGTASAAVARPGPEAACADSGQLGRAFCISIQCFKSEFRQHPTCVRLENETRERRQREIDQGLVGG